MFVFLDNLNCSVIFQGTYTDDISIAKIVGRDTCMPFQGRLKYRANRPKTGISPSQQKTQSTLQMVRYSTERTVRFTYSGTFSPNKHTLPPWAERKFFILGDWKIQYYRQSLFEKNFRFKIQLFLELWQLYCYQQSFYHNSVSTVQIFKYLLGQKIKPIY